MSEKALRYLSRSAARTAMSSGVPTDIAFSGKRGEQLVKAADDESDLPDYRIHELGIIYHPNRPFLLAFCVRGEDTDKINKTIREITRLVYEEVDQQAQDVP